MIEKQKQQLRRAFIDTLTEFAEQDPKVILIIGDVGFSVFEPFIERFPNQFLNAGVAEQNMMGLAAGMARENWKPYVYTMSNFILLRPLEQVRNDICYAKANVKLFGVKGGDSYKFYGMSHNLAEGEEKGMLKFLPNINSYFPATEEETASRMRDEYERDGAAYFSL
ncbi:MAG: hypothetical protein CMI56_03205 [Parcubacteria group bacterium]|nr:hypothetical protein [Parcubacteria group bacterium]|tara:strand:- start:1699 stop:2199 length:501 start_codon:yes stop_codon:yes gene_type:complete